MAKKGKKKSVGSKPKTKTRTRTVTKWKTRNPAKKKGKARARAKRGIAALDIASALRGSVALMAGMVAAKAAVNKITAGGSETERWSWPNIATAALTGFLAAFLLGAVFNLPQRVTSLIFMGGLALSLYKLFTTKVAPKWGWTEQWFGADEDINPALLGGYGYGAGEGEIDIFEPITGADDEYDVVDGYGYGAGEEDLDDTDRMLEQMGYAGNELVSYDPAMGNYGGEIVPFRPEMGYGADDSLSPYPPALNESARSLAMAAKAYPGSY